MKNIKNTGIDMQEFPDCSSLNEKGGCKLLNISRCRGADCHFAHSTEDERKAAVSWRKRLSALSDEEQLRISKKYYGGAMPWK